MAKSHMKRISSPRTWPIDRKGQTFVKRPKPGRQSFEYGMSLQTWLIEVLGIASNAKEARQAIRSGAVKVNGTAAGSQEQIVGLFDVISIESYPDYLITLTKQNRLAPIEIKYDGTNLSRVVSKTIVTGGKTQYGLLDGTTFLSDDDYKAGQTVLVKNGTISKVLALEEGVKVLLLRGASVGQVGTITEVGDEITVQIGEHTASTTRDTFVVVSGYKPLEGEQ